MKVRIQKASSLRTYVDYVERDVFERRSRTVRIENIDGGYGETFSLKTGHAVGSVLAIRIHPDDVPALASLPLRLAKTKPFDLDAHPLAPVLRRVVVMVADATGQIGGDPDYALDAIQDTAIVRDAETCEVLTSCAALALAGLAALDKPKGGA